MRIKRYILIARWFIGAIFQKQICYTRTVNDNDTYEEVKEWTLQMKADGWEDTAAIGNTLYLRKSIDRWDYPE